MKQKVKCGKCELEFADEEMLGLHVVNRHSTAEGENDSLTDIVFSTRETTDKASVIAKAGIHNSEEFVSFMSAVMHELAAGDMKPDAGNAICNASKQMIKMLELKMRASQR